MTADEKQVEFERLCKTEPADLNELLSLYKAFRDNYETETADESRKTMQINKATANGIELCIRLLEPFTTVYLKD